MNRPKILLLLCFALEGNFGTALGADAAPKVTSSIARCTYSGTTLSLDGAMISFELVRNFNPAMPPDSPLGWAASRPDLPADGTGQFYTTKPPARWLAPAVCTDAQGVAQALPVTQATLDSMQQTDARQRLDLRDSEGNLCIGRNCFGTRIAPLASAELEKMVERMAQYTLGPWGCPVSKEALSYVWVTHWTPAGDVAVGELVIATAQAANLVRALRDVFAAGYAIERMRPQDFFQGDDQVSMSANNTSAFRCPRSDQGGEHPLGQAIDINPLHNPFIKPNEKKWNPNTGYENPPPESLEDANQRYTIEPVGDWTLAFRVNRTRASKELTPRARQILLLESPVVRAFSQIGWSWGGLWNCCADYQHFSKDNTLVTNKPTWNPRTHIHTHGNLLTEP